MIMTTEDQNVASYDEPRTPSAALLEMAQAYRQSAVLITACQLAVFTHLAPGVLSVEALAEQCQTPVRGLRRLLNACVVLDLLEKEGETYHNTPIAENFLVEGHPAYMGNFIGSGAEHYDAWGRLIQAIREDRPMNPHGAEVLHMLPVERLRRYVESLYDLGKRNAAAIAERVDLSHTRRMLDVAGGSAIYSIIFAQRQANLRATVFELPPIVPFAQEIIARHDMQAQVSVYPGNYCQDDLGQEYQLVLLSNNLQTEGPETCQMILRKVFAALAPDGQLLIHGVMPHADRVSPPQPAFFQVQMLLSFPEGDAHPAEDICLWAEEAGFVGLAVTRLPAPAFTTLIMGRKPS